MKIAYDFLSELMTNNSKEWMDDNRKYYHQARDTWIDQLSSIYERLAKHDPRFEHIIAKKTVKRINNNRMFHPDRPIYKDNFAASPLGKEIPSLFLSVSPLGNMLGGGVYRPDTPTLKKIRAAIDYDGHELLDIINNKAFVSYFGGMAPDRERLKTSPKGYSTDHIHIELLRNKNFVAMYTPSKREVLSTSFIDIVEEGYLALLPFNTYLARAINYED